ncbi:MAG: LPXTG cell wall anchor domain-containing protein [Oscillospiraceae bacterium]|nr:LPXTG cell wall anchor domain-containing protein [Oscillospiraceae bacterium]
MKKTLAFLLVALLVLSLGATAFAQDVTLNPADADNATISVQNASKGETYAVYKLFDASVTGSEGGSIAYTGDIPSALSTYFTKDSAGNISLTAAGGTENETTHEVVMSDALKAALKTWAASATATASAASDGSDPLNFKGLPYGYYVVTTTQGEQAITVDSTNPNATIVDKNTTNPHDPQKVANDKNVFIGETVTYTISYSATNFIGAGEAAEKVTAYKIADTLPAFLSDVTVTSITVTDGDDHDATTEGVQPADVTAQFNNKVITIAWVDANGNSRYKNNAVVTITYTAKVTDQAAIAGAGNKNDVTITPVTTTDKEGHKITTSETIKTYALAIKKVNDKGEPLSGATFQLPFYVNKTAAADGSCIAIDPIAYAALDTTGKAAYTNSVTTPASGEIVIKGVEAGTYSITETAAPAGYNALGDPVSVTAVETTATTTSVTKYIDADGNVTDTQSTTSVTYSNANLAADVLIVVNKTGVELPSTGGIGTTIFYVVGGLLVLGAAVLLIAKKRVD